MGQGIAFISTSRLHNKIDLHRSSDAFSSGEVPYPMLRPTCQYPSQPQYLARLIEAAQTSCVTLVTKTNSEAGSRTIKLRSVKRHVLDMNFESLSIESVSNQYHSHGIHQYQQAIQVWPNMDGLEYTQPISTERVVSACRDGHDQVSRAYSK